jgi:hypothetical protein
MYDLPDILIHRLSAWSALIYQTLAKDDKSPAGSFGDLEIKQGYCCGYALLNRIVRQFLPAYTKMPSTLLVDRPRQQPTETIQEYFDRYDDWSNLGAILENIGANLCNKNELDSFLCGLQYGDQYIILLYTDRQSFNPLVKSKFSPGNLVITLESKAFLVNQTPDPPNLHSPKPRLASSATSHSTGSATQAVTSSMTQIAFPKSGTYPSIKRKKKKPYAKKLSYDVNSICFTPATPLLDLFVPDNCNTQTLEYVNKVTVYLNSLTNKHSPSRQPHDITRPCAICNQTGHDFNGCKVLKDHEFLQDAVIKSSLYFSNEAKQQKASITASMERKRVSLLHTISTINSMDSDNESVVRYLDQLDDNDDDNDDEADQYFP